MRHEMVVKSKIIATGGYLPDRIITNEELSQNLETSHEWIYARTGICKRHIASQDQHVSDLAFKAVQEALSKTTIDPLDIDLIIVATSTPDRLFPSVATKIQACLKNKKAIAFDLQAACSGFLYALSVADQFIQTGKATTALVIGAEILSRVVDWQDRSTAVLFGDGAGAVLLHPRSGLPQEGCIGIDLYADGEYQDLLFVDNYISGDVPAGYIRMKGKDVMRVAVKNVTSAIKTLLEKHALSVKEIDWMIPHQANIRIMESVAQKINFPLDKIFKTVDQHANTSAASIPLALNTALNHGKISKGDLVLFFAMGAGFTWGAGLVRL